ncbi:MAG: hypothetical protein RBT74_01080 [Tenuifilaceae bacterium]|jgi:hypothetical protein|nr:hypothetical protein [Tenuifilaceae bacterium]
MRTAALIISFLTIILHSKSQNSEVEIYLMQSDSILKGQLLEYTTDSVLVVVDSLNTFVLAKVDLEGKDLPLSNEVKKFQRKLMRGESKKVMNLFPGIYQIRNGEEVKGKIMLALSAAGAIGAVSSGVVFVVILTTASFGPFSVIAAIGTSIVVFASAAVLWVAGSVWSMSDISKKIEHRVKNRYYYRGDISTCRSTLQRDSIR